MTRRYHSNNFVTTLNGDITSGATSIVITSATGFPTVGSGAVANVTLANGSTIEIVTCTARSGTTLTVTRGAESTTPAAFVSGSVVSIRPTANSLDRKLDEDSYTTTATAAGTTTLTVDSDRKQFFTGSTTQTVLLPVTSTLALGRVFEIVNESSGIVTVQSSGANTIQAMAANSILELVCILTSGTGTASWYANYRDKTAGGGTVIGPASSTDNAIARFDSTTGKLIQNSGVIVSDTNGITGVDTLAVTDHISIGGNAAHAAHIYLFEDTDNGTSSINFTAPSSIAGDRVIALPDANGTVTCLGNTSTGSGDVVLATSPTLITPTLGVASATSVNFGQDALNYYDEGTWTPSISFTTPGDLSVSYVTQTGTYTRIGRVVTIYCSLQFTPTYTTASGTFFLTGIPFSPGNGDGFMSILTQGSSLSYPSSRTFINIRMDSAAGAVKLEGFGSGISYIDFTTTEFATGNEKTFSFMGSYTV